MNESPNANTSGTATPMIATATEVLSCSKKCNVNFGAASTCHAVPFIDLISISNPTTNMYRIKPSCATILK